MSMSRADHFYDCNWEKYADENGKIDYEKLWRATHNDYDVFSQEVKAEIAKLEQENKNLHSLWNGSMVEVEKLKLNISALEKQKTTLEARLEKCKEQRDEQVDREFHESQVNERDARVGILNVQLGRITIDSIKRGE